MTTKKTADKPTSKKLDVPYFSQTDNRFNPNGSCNVTSIAMCLRFFGIKGNGNGQLEDQLYQWMESSGYSRHSPHDLAYLVNKVYGVKVSPNIVDTFKDNATVEEIKAHIDDGNPVVVHGYFTAFGHIVVIVGYDENGFIVHDPYGVAPYTDYRSGEGIHYDYDYICSTCADSVGIWAHFIKQTAK